MVILNIFVQKYDDKSIVESFEIDDQETFGSFRNKVAEKFNYNVIDLLLVGQQEYNGSFNSKKISEISGIKDQCTLFAVDHVGGGAIIF